MKTCKCIKSKRGTKQKKCKSQFQGKLERALGEEKEKRKEKLSSQTSALQEKIRQQTMLS